MNELSLFTGAGGGLLGTALLGFRPIGYVEWDDYCQRVIAARIRDGILPNAPIFGDIKTFIDSGCAKLYRGVTDVITAGFPCQPFSVAGKQRGAEDERNMWPATAECIGIVKPRFVLLENVPGIRTYLPVVVRDLRRLGYEVSRPLILGADDVGAPHRRKRVWILANAVRERGAESEVARRETRMGVGVSNQEAPDGPDSNIINGDDAGLCSGKISQLQKAEIFGMHDDPNFASERCENGGRMFSGIHQPPEGNRKGENFRNISGWERESWIEAATRLCRVDDGMAHRVDRIAALGEGQVPAVVATAWRILTQ